MIAVAVGRTADTELDSKEPEQGGAQGWWFGGWGGIGICALFAIACS